MEEKGASLQTPARESYIALLSLNATPGDREEKQKMKTTVQQRCSTPSAITKALAKSKAHSREVTLFPANPGNGVLVGAFCSPNSVFILDERVQLTMGLQTQERHLFLFSDTLIIAKTRASSSLKFKKQVRLSEMWTASCIEEVTEKRINTQNSFVIGWPVTNYVVTFSSSEVKEKWFSALQWQIGAMKKEEFPINLPMTILFLEANGYTSTTTINVSNTETVEKVIKMAVPQLGILGRASDYHLWAISGKNESPYALIGHEQPFSIILNSLRDSAAQTPGTNNNILLTDGLEISLLEQLPKERQCQFILKARPQATVQLRREAMQKRTKRKKSLIDWALRRTGSTPTVSTSSESPTTPRKLFGLSLSSVCPNGILPKPIMDMLLLLYQQGPSTKGIFRRSANAKICKELKEKLNSGDEVQMSGESVFVAAAVITDFLRNIPDSVLSSELYGLWMEAAEMEHQECKIEAMKRLVEQLPEANSILLRHLFGVLHHIEENSEENQMTAFNLALCIAPNMLWRPTTTSPEEESRSMRKVAMLVQFLIENYGKIFGEDTASLFRTSEEEQLVSTEDLMDMNLTQHSNDSSDELEFASLDLDGPKHQLMKDVDELFGVSSGSLLMEEMAEDWDLYSEIAACCQSTVRKNNRTDGFEEDSFPSIGSVGSLSPARDRCSSEPSVCVSSRLPALSHEPVARQSSCDATIMHSHIDYIQRIKQLQTESQRLIDGGLSPSMSKARRDLWRSPQSSSRMKPLGLQKTAVSNRSSFSSLSSTTTSPSASSLSSLDSAFSYCSESSVFSPSSDVSSLPFMFGTSTRLHAVSPESSKKTLKEWHMTTPPSFNCNPCDLNAFNEFDQKVEEKSSRIIEVRGHRQVNGAPQDCHLVERKKEVKCVGGSAGGESLSYGQRTKHKVDHTSFRASETSEDSRELYKETSVKHIEIKSPESTPPSLDNLKRTKITLYVAKSTLSTSSPDEQENLGFSPSGSPNSNSNREGTKTQSPETMKVHIPQTVFYGQNTPLVLHSVSRRHHSDESSPERQTQWKCTLQASPTEEKPVDIARESANSGQEPLTVKSHNKAISSISHTIRIILPASVRNTVKEYFKHGEPKTCCPEAEAVESELLRNQTEWHTKPCMGTASEDLENVPLTEESFV
ncbi:rho GTPase-activating protein 20 [Microcaecilia unicolor]|uniref:Rho GTPase-activating protein 20 n=1 Tax=Microcaecilia unicolor TaxID=1415580 RepID=A0A6P7YKY9_9AMPH|nr:rho GTPase-activating protein 20-like [Microcaecilia unicolor]